jgi:hypothetical protein
LAKSEVLGTTSETALKSSCATSIIEAQFLNFTRNYARVSVATQKKALDSLTNCKWYELPSDNRGAKETLERLQKNNEQSESNNLSLRIELAIEDDTRLVISAWYKSGGSTGLPDGSLSQPRTWNFTFELSLSNSSCSNLVSNVFAIFCK